VAPVVLGAGALERAGRNDSDHEIALTLQRGIIAQASFDSPDTPWSAHYSAATRGLVGGDWYDVIDRDDRVGFAIGDIVGRGLEAAVAMGQVRSASRALANCFDKPDELVAGLDHFAASTGCGEDSSMAYVTINRCSGEIAYCVAGHPPPLVITPDGTPMWLDGANGALLGRGGERTSASLIAEPGTIVVLYTDGLVERRGEPLDEGLARLADAVRTLAAEERHNHARRLAAMIASPQAIDDDVAVLYVTYLGAEAAP
jgi:serine phosphatase RsbU (regulator of sigma subunit)